MNLDTTENEFQRLVTSSSDRELAALMADPAQRPAILRRIFELWCAGVDPVQTAKVDALIRWQIGRPADTWDMHILHGACTAVPGPTPATPVVTITLGDVPFLRVIARQANGVHLLATRKMRISGSIPTAMRLDAWFP
ncbi:SCP2 sterol-binding domain-containing protein [Nocardia sp. NPDC127579]|uniref:SCP2 sterol-binding domain-containing protein n=1 Tax=Nocardia sp. NPDC127579 TaxID=3345402 RepID=UPI003637668D